MRTDPAGDVLARPATAAAATLLAEPTRRCAGPCRQQLNVEVFPVSPQGVTSAWPGLDGGRRTVLQQQVYLGRQDAMELATLVRSGGPEGIGKFLVGLDSRRKDAVLVALASAVDVERSARQWWAWLDGPDSAGPPVRSVPRAAEVARFARAYNLSADQVWRAIVALQAASAPAVVRSDSNLGGVPQ